MPSSSLSRFLLLFIMVLLNRAAYQLTRTEAFLFRLTSRSSSSMIVAAAAAGTTTTVLSSSSELHLSSESDVDSNNDADDADAYHLLWSPRAWTQFLATSAALILLPKLLDAVLGTQINQVLFSASSSTGASCHSGASASASHRIINSLWSNWALPLLASSCCLIQLGLNALAVGCAGWNKVLGPLRPYFLALLLCTSISNKPTPSVANTITLAARATVALLPEIVHWYNERQEERQQRLLIEQHTVTVQSNDNNNPVSNENTVSQQQQLPQPELDQIQMDIPSMGCSACVSAVNGALRKIPGVVSAYSKLYNGSGNKSGGYAVVVMDPIETSLASGSFGTASSSLYESLLTTAVTKAGFSGATVQAVESNHQ